MLEFGGCLQVRSCACHVPVSTKREHPFHDLLHITHTPSTKIFQYVDRVLVLLLHLYVSDRLSSFPQALSVGECVSVRAPSTSRVVATLFTLIHTTQKGTLNWAKTGECISSGAISDYTITNQAVLIFVEVERMNRCSYCWR